MKISSSEKINEHALIEAIKDELFNLTQTAEKIDDEVLETVAQKFRTDIAQVRRASQQL